MSAVYDLLDRVLPGARGHFTLALSDSACASDVPPPCFRMQDEAGGTGRVSIIASSASELTAALGVYLREWCNMTIGWPRGGGSHIFTPAAWPRIGSAAVARRRAVPWSYIMNVCTHSYSLVWYDWAAWERFIDWMALSGINHALAMTGQEEVQYKVFAQLGLTDEQIRTWFNGPAFLTWSRGQNEYGNNIAGPLPRSFMQAQWALQRMILARYRSLGIVGQLPGFQGNVPIALKDIFQDANITQQGDTGWMYSTDPLFGRIADLWMKTLIEDFGTDHWYQMDGYFNGGTAPWFVSPRSPSHIRSFSAPTPVSPGNPPCQWGGALRNAYLPGCAQDCKSFASVEAAQEACAADATCGGITVEPTTGRAELRSSISPRGSPSGETSYVISNEFACHRMPADPTWRELGVAAYTGLNRTDPDAIWSFQGWAIIDWNTAWQASQFQGFVDSAPAGRFVVVDMSVDGSGEWGKWDNASFFGANFIWTTLHDFGGTDGIKGDLRKINAIPFTPQPTTAVGTGYTPEGIDQNPVYYELMAEVNFHAAPLDDVTGHTVLRAHRRYGLAQPAAHVTRAWTLLAESAYTQDLSVQDGTGVPHLPGWDTGHFLPDRRTPVPTLCMTYAAWGELLAAAAGEVPDPTLEPFRYDLVNLGREVLAQLSTPLSANFSDAFSATHMDPARLAATGQAYITLLGDIDTLLATDSAFLLGPWLAAARAWGAGSSDCGMPCGDFYEWNARTQITTWNPTPYGAEVIPGGPIDYASKHWNGLVRDYYMERANRILALALTDAAAGQPLNTTALNSLKASLAYTFTTSTSSYPTQPVGDAVAVSKAMHDRYAPYFAACSAATTGV